MATCLTPNKSRQRTWETHSTRVQFLFVFFVPSVPFPPQTTSSGRRRKVTEGQGSAFLPRGSVTLRPPWRRIAGTTHSNFRQPMSGYVRLHQPTSANFDPLFFSARRALAGGVRHLRFASRDPLNSITHSSLFKPVHTYSSIWPPPPGFDLFLSPSPFPHPCLSVSIRG